MGSRNPDSLSSAPSWKTYTLAAANIDFLADGGGPVRAIRADGAGNLDLVPASPLDSQTSDVTPFLAGERQDVQAVKVIVATSTAGLKFTAYW